ncbi:MAG TPA: hypothetical protein VNI02_21840 [Blastocatellia bacterium]|jgi:hypothetical protein|nr:hypothetical protein [Blastocatellia bacterium]
MAAKAKKTCFVIMPFGEKQDVNGEIIDFDKVYKYIIKKVLQDKLKLKVTRSDEIQQAGSIIRDMISHISNDDVAVVDITSLNPNVFYELGVRHSLRPSVTVLIRKKGTSTPFNIQGLRIIEYDLDVELADRAREQIEAFIRNGLNSPGVDSRVYDVFPNMKVTYD